MVNNNYVHKYMCTILSLYYRKLKAAKDKLARLQELVTSLQQSPGAAHGFPEELAELTAGFNDDESATTSQTSEALPRDAVSG